MSDCQNCGKISDFASDNLYTWCTNCGNYAIDNAVKRALAAENLAPHQILMCYDIGCHGNGADKFHAYSFHGLHGRVIPLAAGAAISNRRIKVVAHAGDGGTLSEGIHHFVHAIRSDYNMVFLLHNNNNYGLTKGQPSATTPQGVSMNFAPDGSPYEPINVMDFALSLQPSFAARTFSGDVKQMAAIIQAALKHKGFALVEILQHCPSYNKATPHEWYQERVYDTITLPNYDNTNLASAREVAQDLTNRIATGILYHNHSNVDYLSRMQNRTDYTTELVDEVQTKDISQLVEKFK